jgi:hypothetical protein
MFNKHDSQLTVCAPQRFVDDSLEALELLHVVIGGQPALQLVLDLVSNL